MRSVRTAALALFLSISLAPCFAQHAAAERAAVSKDELELQSYTLTMENVTHAFQAAAAMNEAMKNDSSLRGSLKGGDESQQTLDQMSAKLSSSQKAVAILSSNGLTPRKFSLTMMSLVVTGMAVAALEMGAKSEDVVTKAHVNPANIAFARAHKAELEELGRKYPINSND